MKNFTENSDIDQLIFFWSDIQILFLKSAMEKLGEIQTMQYVNVCIQSKDVKKRLGERGLGEDQIQKCIAVFQATHANFKKHKLHETISENMIPASLVALTVQDFIGQKLDAETLKAITQKAFSYLSSKT